jgi:hypothetical protein
VLLEGESRYHSSGPDTCGAANYNSFCIDGRPVQEFKVRLRPTAIRFPTVVHSRRIPAVLDAGRQMIAALSRSDLMPSSTWPASVS